MELGNPRLTEIEQASIGMAQQKSQNSAMDCLHPAANRCDHEILKPLERERERYLGCDWRRYRERETRGGGKKAGFRAKSSL